MIRPVPKMMQRYFMRAVRSHLLHRYSTRASSTLHCEQIPATAGSTFNNHHHHNNTILFLHGLFGNNHDVKELAENVVTVGNESNISATNGILVDLRGHGQSRDVSQMKGPNTFASCVDDIHTTLDSISSIQVPPCIVMGHSWGGRIALQYVHSLLGGSNVPTLPDLSILDSTPGGANPVAWKILDAVDQVDFQNKTREDVEHELVHDFGLDSQVARLLSTSSLKENDNDTLEWNFDEWVVRDVLPEAATQDYMGMLEAILDGGGNVHLVKAEFTEAWRDESLLAPLNALQDRYPFQFHQHTLEHSGHWVQFDNLPGLVDIVREDMEVK